VTEDWSNDAENSANSTIIMILMNSSDQLNVKINVKKKNANSAKSIE